MKIFITRIKITNFADSFKKFGINFSFDSNLWKYLNTSRARVLKSEIRSIEFIEVFKLKQLTERDTTLAYSNIIISLRSSSTVEAFDWNEK